MTATAIIQPALIIGLGGSGTDIVRRFKRRFRAMHADTPYVRFLGVDTAPQTAALDSLPQLTDDEFLWAAGFKTEFYVGRDYIDNHPSIRRWWKGYDQLPAKFVNAGAGMKRPVGRLAFFVNYAKVVARLEAQFQTMFNDRVFFDLPEQYRRGVNIYIVSSTCGGTGTGMFLDMAYLARHIASQRFGVTPLVRGLLLLPSAFLGTGQVTPQNSQNLQLNALGALSELDFAMSHRAELENVEFPDSQRVSRATEPFTSCYLVGNQVEQGAIISDFVELQERAAVHLQIELASPLSDTGVAMIDNVLMAIAVKPDAQGHRRLYSSFSGDWIELPSARVLARWLKRQASRTVDRLRKGEDGDSASKAAERLTDAGGYGSLRSLFAGEGIAPYLPKVDAFSDAFLDVGTDGRQPAYLVQAAQQMEAEAQTQINRNTQLPEMVRQSLTDLGAEVESRVKELLGETSAASAKQFVAEVRKELSGWLARAQNEIAGAEQGRWLHSFTEAANNHRRGLIGSKDKYVSDQRQMVIDASEQARDEWRRAVRARIAQQAQTRIPAVLLQLDDLSQRLSGLITVLDAAAASIQRIREPEITQDSSPRATTDAAIDDAFEAAGRPARLDAVTRRSIQSDFLTSAAPSADSVVETIVNASRQAVLQIAPEYLQSLTIPADEIANRMNRLSPLAVFTSAWPASPYAQDIERLSLIGLPSSMSLQSEQVEARLSPTIRAHTQVMTTGDEDRVVITVQNHGFPLFALQEIHDCRRTFEAADPQQKVLCFVQPDPAARDWNVMPVSGQEALQWFAIGLATGRLRRAGQEYLYNSGLPRAVDVPLGSGSDPAEARQAARDAFLQSGYAAEVRQRITARVAAEGNPPLYNELKAWAEQQDVYAKDPAFPPDFAKETAAVRQYMASIPPF